MINITFADVIRFYPSNNDAVYRDLKAALRGGHLTPFVGAGLSVFCGYKLWPDVLTELSEFIPDDEPKSEAQELILQNKYLEAAEYIHQHYDPMMRRLQGIVTFSKIDDCPDERMYSSAAWVLPRLFGDKPLMTTNFDGVLEYVFAKQNCAFERVAEPHDPSLLTQIRQKNSHGLFKLHGDIGKETTSIDRLVFTQSQYDKVYCEDGELIGELRQWYQNQTLLFLGCSLAMDKTMEVLRNVALKDSGIRHFAIVGCKPDQRSEFLKRLGELGIDALFYNDDNHDAVRVILENLLYEINQPAFQQLDEERCRFVGPVRRDDVLMYNAGRIKYVGRSEEWEKLERFCGSAPTNEWWAITGPGGMGKSRLIYEFTNKKQSEGWQIRWFSRDQYDQLPDFQLLAQDTIVVLDDVQADIQAVGNWLNSMRDHRRRNRLRILLLERDGKDYETADWIRLLRSGSPYSDPLSQWCHNQTFLHLKPLEDTDLKMIMTNCAEALGKQIDTDALLTALLRVDHELKRPLYALAVAEATCNGEDPIRWNPERVLDEMLNRELAFHYECLKFIIGTTPTRTQQQDLEDLMARCCIRGRLGLEEVNKERYPYLTACMDRMSPREFFRCLGLLQTEKEREILRMNCPDLIREHLVLRLAIEQRRMNLLLSKDWQKDIVQISYLNHLVRNHSKRFDGMTHFWEQILRVEQTEQDICEEYARLLWSITVYYDNYRSIAVEQLEQLFGAYSSNPNIRIAYAAGIYNLSLESDFEGRISSERKLTELHRIYSEDRGIALALAKSLSSLTSEQSMEDCTGTVMRLTELSEAYPGERAFSLELAKGLSRFAFVLEWEDRTATVKRLTELSEAYPGDRAFLFELAICLRSLTYKADTEQCINAIEQLNRICNKFHDDVDFASQIEGALVNLALAQTTEEAVRDTLSQSEVIQKTYLNHADIQLSHAMTWFNLTLVQKEDDIPATVSEIITYLKVHADIIPEFMEALDLYLSEHPEHVQRYHLLLKLKKTACQEQPLLI